MHPKALYKTRNSKVHGKCSYRFPGDENKNRNKPLEAGYGVVPRKGSGLKYLQTHGTHTLAMRSQNV